MQEMIPPPRAERVGKKDELHGKVLEDPYQWLEDEKAEPVQSFMKAHDDFARSKLMKLPKRDTFLARLKKLSYIDSRSAPKKRGERTFWAEKGASQEKSVYYWQAEGGKKKVLLDPLALRPDGTLSIGSVIPSPDGKLVAYLEQPDNADESNLRIMEVETGKTRPQEFIAGLRYTEPSWSADGSGFYYTWLPTDPAIPTNEKMAYAEIRYHALGTDPSKDRTFSEKTGDPTQWQGAEVTEDGRWLIMTTSRGWSETTVRILDLNTSSAKPVEITEGLEPGIYDVTGYQGQFFVRTNVGASRYRIYRFSADKPRRKAWKEIIPQSKEAVLDGMAIFGKRLVVHRLEKAASKLGVYSLQGERLSDINLPGLGTVSGLVGRADQDTFYFGFESLNRSDEIWEATRGSAKIFHQFDLGLRLDQLVVKQVQYPSKDGTMISMFLVHGPNLEKDGQQPTLLYGYGGFNISLTPRFAPEVVAWVESGGIYAMPNLRGGGEYGEAWHQAGMLENKQNVFDDFISAAEWLVKENFTSPEHLAIGGRSNGGLLVGAAMTQRPDLFRAVLCGVPLLDMVRYHKFGIGRAWIPEYGSADNEADFGWLLAYSPYHRIKKGTQYPALLMLSADHDDRVDPLHARKFVAAIRWATESTHPVYLRIESNSGHGGADMRSKRVARIADELAFLAAELDPPSDTR